MKRTDTGANTAFAKNLDEFQIHLSRTGPILRKHLQDFLKSPTERNSCYIVGYLSAMKDVRAWRFPDDYSYWLSFCGAVEAGRIDTQKVLAFF